MQVNQAKAFFAEMASKYGRYPNVLWEPFNEPEQIDWTSAIKPYHEQIVPVIRRHSDNLIILGTRTWSQEVDTAAWNPVAGRNLGPGSRPPWPWASRCLPPSGAHANITETDV